MNTSDRAYSCQTKKCGSSGSKKAVRPKSVVFERSIEDDRAKISCKSKSNKNSPERCSSGEKFEHESTLNLMSETLMSVANKLEKVFNSPKERLPVTRPTIKRVYVIKFDENNLEGKKSTPKTPRRFTQVASDYERSMKRRSQTNLVEGEGKQTPRTQKSTQLFITDPTSDRRKPIDDKVNTDGFSDEYERSSNDGRKPPSDRGIEGFTNKPKLLSSEDSFSDLINKVTSPPGRTNRPSSGSRRKSGFNHKFLLRDDKLSREPRKNGIPDIFNAILEEVGSLSLKNRITPGRQRNQKLKSLRNPRLRTLSEVLESEESLMSAEYTIPRSMIKKEAIDRLQTLIDRADKRSRRAKTAVSDTDADRDGEIVEWEVPERIPVQTNSYYTTVINDRDANNDIDTSSSVVSGPICRICHGRHGTLVKPCRCRGTLAYVHVECLQVWLTEKDVNFCELCHFTFRVINVPEYKIIPSIGFWYKFAATSQQRRSILVDLTLAIVLLPCLIFLTIFVRSFTSNADAEYEEDEDFADSVVWHFGQLTIKVAMFLIILSYIAGVLIRASHHLSDWFSWYVNKNVTVVLEDLSHNRGDEAD